MKAIVKMRILRSKYMKNLEAIAKSLLLSADGEDEEILSFVADYISCPSEDECHYDGKDNTCCNKCKVKWLQKEWED